MKKVKMGLVTLVALGVLYTGLAWVVGMRAQSMVARAVEEGNQRLAQVFGESSDAPRATITDYQRGVFSSQLRYTINLDGMGMRDMGDVPQTVQFHVGLQHGPLPWDLLRRGEFTPQLIYGQLQLLPTPWTQPWFDVAGERALRIETRIGFSQDGSGVVTLAPITLEKDGSTLSFSGGQVSAIFTNRFADSESTGHFASLDIVEQGENRVRIRDITVSGQLHRGSDVEQSDSHIGVSSIDLDLEEIGQVQIENFGIDFAAEQVGTLLDYKVQYRLGSTTIDGQKMGAFDLGASAKRIDLPAVMGLVQALEQIEQGGARAQGFNALRKHAHALLKAQPTIAFDPLRWGTEKGESSAVLTADLFVPDGHEDVTFEDLGLQYVREANLSVDVSRAMALHIAGMLSGHDGGDLPPQMLAMLFDQTAKQLQSAGLVRIDGDHVRLQARYIGEDEMVELNGEYMSLAEFVVLVMRSM